MKYKVIFKDNIAHLEKEVNKQLRLGWTLRGDLIVMDSPDFCSYYQAVVIEEFPGYSRPTPEPEPVPPDIGEGY